MKYEICAEVNPESFYRRQRQPGCDCCGFFVRAPGAANRETKVGEVLRNHGRRLVELTRSQLSHPFFDQRSFHYAVHFCGCLKHLTKQHAFSSVCPDMCATELFEIAVTCSDNAGSYYLQSLGPDLADDRGQRLGGHPLNDGSRLSHRNLRLFP